MKAYFFYISFSLFLFGCKAYSEHRDKVQKPYFNDYSINRAVISKHGGVVSAHPLASKIGQYILQQGGNAIDAAIAVQLALAVVYPEAGNLGGGGFMIIRLADGTNLALDFREKAPGSAHRDMYLDNKGQPIKGKSLKGHLASGVPGTVAGIFECLKYAKLPFEQLIQPAIDLAERGFVVIHGITHYGFVYNKGELYPVAYANPKFNTKPNVFDGSYKWKEGDNLRQVDLANTLKRIRDRGKEDFYEGETARLIVAEMKRGGGNITIRDLKNYEAKWRDPHIFNYRGYSIVTMPLPSSGGILLNQMLKMIEPYPMQQYGFGSINTINLMTEVERRAFEDRAKYLGDADFSSVPVSKLTSSIYLQERMKNFTPGKPGTTNCIGCEDLQTESKETTHISIVDREGNAVSVTTTLNMAFGSQVLVGGAGFLLNNQMNDFSLKPGVRNASGGTGGLPNSIEPGKRMLSSMTPTVVLKEDKLFMVVGSPGGTTIPTSVFQTIVNIIDFNMSPIDAVYKPKFHHEWNPDIISMEESFFPADTVAKLKELGYTIKPAMLGRVELICIGPNNVKELIADFRGGIDCAEGY